MRIKIGAVEHKVSGVKLKIAAVVRATFRKRLDVVNMILLAY